MFFGNQKQTEWAWQANTHFTSSFLSQSQYLFRREFFLWVINFFLLFIARWMDVLECAGKGGKPGSVPCSYSIAAEAFQQKSQHRAHIPFVSKMDHQAMEWLQRNACIMLLTFCYSQNRRGGKKRAMDEHFPQIVDFFLLVRCKGGFPVGTWEAGAVPLPSHTFEKSQRVYIREEQEVKEIVNSSEMLQGRLDAGG